MLSPGLTPIIEFQNVEREMLGHPYSVCVPTNSSKLKPAQDKTTDTIFTLANDYSDSRLFYKYYQETSCVFKALIREVQFEQLILEF